VREGEGFSLGVRCRASDLRCAVRVNYMSWACLCYSCAAVRVCYSLVNLKIRLGVRGTVYSISLG
jgi:hypothetical protein